ncbi:MAG: hypothetical protein H6818_03200 [Phycisphaerales bacterium]|nr:hypothetical protein [Phycisphaerales bacterium]
MRNLAFLTCITFIASAINAAEIQWVGDPSECAWLSGATPASASFFDEDVWLGGILPGPNDVAVLQDVFDPQQNGTQPHRVFLGNFRKCPLLPCSEAILQGADTSIASLRVRGGDWEVDAASGFSDSCPNPIADTFVGGMNVLSEIGVGTGGLTTSSLLLRNGSFTASNIYVGVDGGVARLSLDNANVQTGTLGVGGDSGEFEVSGAESTLTKIQCCDISIGGGTGNNGALRVINGASAVLEHGFFAIGREGGAGDLRIENGGRLEILDGSSAVGTGIGSNSVTATGVAKISGDDSSWINSGSLIVGEAGGDGQILIEEGGHVLVAEPILIGRESSSGSVRISGDGSQLETARELIVGARGEGVLEVTAGAFVATEIFGRIGENLSTQSRISVSDPLSRLQVGWFLEVGESAEGTLEILDGAEVDVDEWISIGRFEAGDGSVIVSGDGASLQSEYSIVVGESGHGRMEVSNGARVSSNQWMGVASNALSTGELVVDGLTSRVELAQWLHIGESGQGQVTLANDGAIQSQDWIRILPNGLISGDGVLDAVGVENKGVLAPGSSPNDSLVINGAYEQRESGILRIEIDESTPRDLPRLNVNGNAIVSGMLEIQVDAGFEPMLGDEFTIIAANSLGDWFRGVSGLELGGGLVFGVRQEFADGRTFVILTVTQAPDLAITDLQVPLAGQVAYVNNAFEVEWTVRNVGAGRALAPWRDAVYLSVDQSVSEDDLLLQEVYSPVGFLDPGIEYTQDRFDTGFNSAFSLPGFPGDYWVIVKTDSVSNVEELGIETNNVSVSEQPIHVVAPSEYSCNWVLRTQGEIPDRCQPAMAFDVERGVTVLFGGDFANGGGLRGDTWEWDGTSWTQANPDPAPIARASHAMAYDSLRHQVLLFGGNALPNSGGEGLNDLWAWDGNAWTLLASEGPGPRLRASMAYDVARDRVVLFGGATTDGEPLSDTWEWDGTSWASIDHAGPAARHSAGMAYDETRQRIVLFGGAGIGCCEHFGDTWEYSDGNWQLVTDIGPEPRAGHAVVYDSVRKRVLMVGGGACCGLYRSYTWEWDGQAWANDGVLGPRFGAWMAMAFDRLRSRTVLLACGSGEGPTWELFSGVEITEDPAGQSLFEGQAFVLSVDAVGCEDLSFQWRRNGSDLSDDERVSGAQSAELHVAPAIASDVGEYDVVVSNNRATTIGGPALVDVDQGPDLAITEISVSPDAAITGQTVALTWTVQNAGLASASGPWLDRLVMSTDDQFGNDDDVALFSSGIEFTGVLSPGATYSRVREIALPMTPGSYWFAAVTNVGSDLAEVTSGNNALIMTNPVEVTQAPIADLVVTDVLTPSDGVLSGTTTTIEYTVHNMGNAPTSIAHWNDLVFIAIQDNITWTGINGNDQIFCNLDAPSIGASNPQILMPGESYTNSVAYHLPEDRIGEWYVYVLADKATGCHPGTSVPESNKLNNARRSAMTFRIDLAPQPDLIASDIDASPNPVFSGEMLTVTWTETNQGTGPTDGGAWTDAVYLSTTDVPIIGPDDILFDTRPRNGAPLLPDASLSLATTERLPVALEGTFYVKIVSDASGQVSEFGFESNNVSVGANTLTVIQSVQPDLVPMMIGSQPTGNPGNLVEVTWSVENIGPDPQTSRTWRDTIYLSAIETLDDTAVLLGSAPHGSVTTESGPTIAPYSKTRQFRLPNNIPDGEYFVIVSVDVDDAVFELADGEENNVLASTLPMTIQLVPADLTIATNFDPNHTLPQSAAPAQSIALSWRITNSGLAATPVSTWRDRAYLSNDNSLGSGDTLLATQTRGQVLEPGASYDVTANAVLPLVAAGDYFIIVRTDDGNDVFEAGTGEANNLSISPFIVTGDASDLSIVSISSPDAVQSGQSVHVAWTVTNAGTLTTNAVAWVDHVYLSTDQLIDSGDLILGARTHSQLGGLPVGESYTQSADFLVPPLVGGIFYILVRTDVNNSVFETNENNNVLSAAMVINVEQAPLANLTVSNVSLPETAVSGQPLSVSWTVENNGQGPTNGSSWNDSVFLSRDLFFDPGEDLYLGGRTRNGPLPTDGSYSVSMELDIPFGRSGLYYVFIVTDRNAQVAEANEDDNIAIASDPVEITLPAPSDLMVTEITPGVTAELGQEIFFSWVVTNIGDQPVMGGWRDSAYLSADDQWDINDPRIRWRVGNTLTDSYPVPPTTLNPGDSRTITATGRIPAGLPGTYHVIVRSDVFNQIPETDESNNLSVSAGTLDISAIQLELGTPYEGNLATGEELFFQLDVPAGETIRINLNHASPVAWTEMYVRYGAVPTLGKFDFAFDSPARPNQEITIPETQDGRYYILARVSSGASGGSLTGVHLQYAVPAFGAEIVAPHRLGQARATIRVSGAKLGETASLYLRGQSNGELVAPINAVNVNPVTIVATFDCENTRPGSYDLVIESINGAVSVLQSAIEVELGVRSAVEIEMDISQRIRRGTIGIIPVSIRNTGNIDIPIVKLDIYSGDQLGLTIYPMAPEFTLEPSAQNIAALDFLMTEFSLIDEKRFFIFVEMDQGFTGSEIPLVVEATPYGREEFRDGPFRAHADLLRASVLASPESTLELRMVAEDPNVWWSVFREEFDINFGQGHGGRQVSDLQLACGLYCGLDCGLLCFLSGPGTFLCDLLVCTPVCSYACDWCSRNPERCQVALNCNAITLLVGRPDLVPVCILVPVAVDPNLKIRLSGQGEEGWVSKGQQTRFRVELENLEVASAPASRIEIRDAMPIDGNLGTVRLGDIHFGDTTIDVPDNRVSFNTTVDLTATHGVMVEVIAGVNATTREVFWILRSIDPATGEPPLDGSVGFLPPEDGTGRGQGWVEFSIRPESDVATGTIIRNTATITFDAEEPIVTNEVFNTIDADAPSSSVVELQPVSESRQVELAWAGDDVGSGLSSFTIFGSVDNEPFFPVIGPTDEFGSAYEGRGGGTYAFYSIARDNAGNFELAPDEPDATTYVAIQVPTAPELVSPTSVTVSLLGLGENNLDSIEHAVYEATSGKYVAPTGRLQDEPYWQGLKQWEGHLIRALNPETEYRFQAKARDDSGNETPFGAESVITTSIAGDVNGDSGVNTQDIELVQSALGTHYGDTAFDPRADVNGDDVVNFIDLGLVRQQVPCPNPGSGDFDGNGVSVSDIEEMTQAMLHPAAIGVCVGDMNQDGVLNGSDIALFVEAILSE